MASSVEFISKMSNNYIFSLRSGLPYNFAYDLALYNTAKEYGFVCAPVSQELKLNLFLKTINENSSYPPEITKMINLFGAEVTESKITELFVSCMDGTLISNGFDEVAANSIIQKVVEYINKQFITVRILCDCEASSYDPCRVVASISSGKNVRYSLPSQLENSIEQKIESFLANSIGTNIEIENLSSSDVAVVKDVFIETLNILYNNGQTKLDPNSQEPAAIITDFFDQANLAGSFSGSDFVVLLSLLNSSGQSSRLTSAYGRMFNRLSRTIKNFSNITTTSGPLVLTPDYSSNSVLFSSALQFDTNNVSCDPNNYPAFPSEYGIKTSCECDPPEEKCNVSFIANVVTNPAIYEIPYFYATGKVTAELPMPPDVQFIPYKDVDNLILINLNSMAGRYTTKFVSITSADVIYLEQLASSRGVGIDSLFTFEGDLDAQRYEAFRLDYHPEKFSDFESANIYSFQNYKEGFRRNKNTSFIRDVDHKAFSNAISQEHYLEPNKKYYYIFRTIDVNNNISNPSKIFEVEMVNNGGAIFPIIRTVDFKKSVTTTDKAEMRRMLLMSPTKSQVDIYSATSELVENYNYLSAKDALRNLKLSKNVENPIWGKKFKIRITSLDTGRMLDINVTPTTSIIEPPESCAPNTISNTTEAGDNSTVTI